MTGVLIAGTSSDAGKSLVVAGLCRALARRGVRVAPFKAQNMSNNSMVCRDPDGTPAEIGRAQWLQARGAGVDPISAMNPVLLKPGSDRRSFVVLRGHPAGQLEAGEYATGRAHLAEAAFAAYAELAAAYDLVVCEGAGSPAEINLRRGDYVNFGLARQFDLPVVLVGDIDRGGVLASIFGTWGLVDDPDRALLKGYLINKFRGDPAVLDPGLAELTRRTGLKSLGVLPWLEEVWLDGEDTLRVDRWPDQNAKTVTSDGVTSVSGPAGTLTVAVIRFPRLSNATDIEALAAEPGVEVVVTTQPHTVRDADLVILPGSRSTVSDLAWLRHRGLDRILTERAATGRPILGICGGFQMLTARIHDEVEATRLPTQGFGRPDPVRLPGLGLLPATTVFQQQKILALPSGHWRSHLVSGYEIHHGRVTLDSGRLTDFPGGGQVGNIWGTMWHGTLEQDAFRRAWLTEVAGSAGSSWRPDPDAPRFTDRREAMLDRVADALGEHCPPELWEGLVSGWR